MAVVAVRPLDFARGERWAFQSSHAALPTAHLRVVQVLVTAWLFTGQSLLWPAPERIPAQAWGVALALSSSALCLGVLFTPFTRACCLGLAALIALELVVSPTWFAHNRLFVCALLVMVSLSSRRFAALPRWQVALAYAAAAIDKALEPAWRDGRFFESFIAQLARFGLMWAPGGKVGAPNPLAGWLDSLGTRPVWMLVGLSVIALELLLAASFVVSWRPGAWANAAFHVGVFALTGGTMGQFFFAGAAASLLLVRDEDQPPAWLPVLLTAGLAGPWTHRVFPVVLLVALAVFYLRTAPPSRR